MSSQSADRGRATDAGRLLGKLVCLSLIATLDAQQPVAADDLPTDWSNVVAQLEPEARAEDATTRARLTRTAALALVRAFLDRWEQKAPAMAPEIVAARLRLASLLLAGLECEAAEIAFQTVLDSAPEPALDLRGRAMYGVAQARILAGKKEEGRTLLERMRTDLEGTRWGDYARIALGLLRQDTAATCRVGQPAPEIGTGTLPGGSGPRLDRSGRSLMLAALRGGPTVLIFVAPLDDVGMETARVWIAATRRAGLPPERVLVFALGTDGEAIDTPSQKDVLAAAVLDAPSGFLDAAAVRYRVKAVPTSVLIGPDGTLLARDLTPRALEQAVRELLR